MNLRVRSVTGCSRSAILAIGGLQPRTISQLLSLKDEESGSRRGREIGDSRGSEKSMAS